MSGRDKSHPKAMEATHGNDPFSTFTGRQKRLLACAASTSAMFSGLASFIYYPAITALARDLHTSVENINLSITTYLVVAGVAPSFLGDMADRMGRRPVSIIALTLFFAVNLGLVIQNGLVELLILRCLQIAGASSTIAIAYGIIADISTPAERGSYMGILMGFTNVAPSARPILGGMFVHQLSWHWVFWFLAIISGAHLCGYVVIVSGDLAQTCGK